jgi:hypothetical protein
MLTVSVGSPLAANDASRVTLCDFVPDEKWEMPEVGLSLPGLEVRLHVPALVVACPTTPNVAETAAEAGPAGIQARAEARAPVAETARARRSDLDLSMGVLP